MSFFQETGVLTSRTSTGTDVVTLTGTGASLTPQLIMLTMNGATATGGANADYMMAIGYSDGTDERCVFGVSEDNVGTSNAVTSMHDDSILSIYDTSGSLIDQCVISATGVGTFTVNWTTKSATAYKVGYTSWGGTDITNVKIATKDHDTTNVNGTSVAFTGVGFSPDAMMFIENVSASGQINGIQNFLEIALGMCDANGNQGFATVTSNDSVVTSNTQRYQRTDRCLATIAAASSTVLREHNISSFDADGWTWVDEVSNNFAQQFFYIAVKGGRWQVGNGTTNTSASTKAFTTSFQPKGFISISRSNTSGSTVSTHNWIGIGSTDGVIQYSFLNGDDDGRPTTETGIYHDISNTIVTSFDVNASTGISTLTGAGAFDSFNATDVTFDWSANADDAAREFIWLVCAGDEGGSVFKLPTAASMDGLGSGGPFFKDGLA